MEDIMYSLDIEGAEYLVLQTLPWDKLDIQVSKSGQDCVMCVVT